ncbi:SpoIIE family protein phosphatase [Streptomyces sp. NPDC050315]|uniref:SpoIIE family protein phosphatase n=1 Tax=Streptomyces sp. NPDC050315 TaxID=3155039 RepID=UPI00341D92A9
MGKPVIGALTSATEHIRIDHYSAVHLAAQIARSLAQQCALPGALPDQAAVVASELGSNIAKHATDGALFIQHLPLGSGVEILAADRGPGMPELQRCLADGYSTTATLGAGLGAVSRIATDFLIRTQGATGTLACARVTAPEQPPSYAHDVGALCLPADGEPTSGDACAIIDTDLARTAIVVDGLGHGPAAAEAAQSALRAFHRAPDRPLPEILNAIHRALRRTRGGAVGLLRLYPGRAEYCGIGNVRALALTPHGVHHRLTGQPGIAGLHIPAPQVRGIPWEQGSTAVLHTDGIDHRWALAPPPHLLRLPPPLLAAALAHSHRLTRDDATVLVAASQQRLP